MEKTGEFIGPDTNNNVIHYVYPEGRTPTKEELNPYIGGWYKKCRHIYENVGSPICPDCGRDTHEIDDAEQHRLFKEFYQSDEPKKYLCEKDGGTIRGWWSI